MMSAKGKTKSAAQGSAGSQTATSPPALDMTAPGRERHIEVKVSKQATDSMREVGSSEYEIWNNSLLHRTMMAAPPW